MSAILPRSVADLNLRDDGASRRAAERLAEQAAELNDTRRASPGSTRDGNGKRVTIFGITGLRLTPEQDVQAEIDRLTAEYDIRDVEPFDLGEAGVHERCGVGRSERLDRGGVRLGRPRQPGHGAADPAFPGRQRRS